MKYPYGDGAVKLVDTEWAETHLDDEEVMFVDAQPHVHDYLTEHLPGAVHLAEGQLRTMRNNLPARYNPSSVTGTLLSELGIDNDTPTVVYTGKGAVKGWGDGQHQATVAYVLARYGNRDVHLLDGGLQKWKEENRPLTQDYPDREPTRFNTTDPDWVLGYDEFLELRERGDTVVLDARPSPAYEGQAPWSKPGHIPGAINLPWNKLYHDDNPTLLRPLDDLENLMESKGVTRDLDIICHCGTGRFANNLFTVLNWVLNYPNVTFFEGGFTEWIAHPENETETGPGPA